MGRKDEGQLPIQLSIIVPITRMFGKLDGLKKWLSEIDFRKTEVVLVHDLQDKFTSVELHLLMTEHPMLRIIEQSFMSAGLARNAGLEVTQAPWILFWDSDDVPNVSVLNKFLEHPRKESFDLFVFNFKVENNGSTLDIKTRSWQELAVNPGLWRIVFSRSLVSDFLFPNFPLGEDQYFLAQLQLPSYRICFQRDFLYTYKVGMVGQATSNNSNLPRLKDSLLALNSIRTLQFGDCRQFTSILYWRQIFTLLKRGNFILKIHASLIFLRSLFRIDSNYLTDLKALRFLVCKLLVRRV